HGTVEKASDIPAFLQNIRRGRPTPDSIVHEVTERFEAIGGSPMMRITREQAAALETRLGVVVRACARMWHPYPPEVIGALKADGVETIVSVPLAPQSVHIYNTDVEKAAAEAELQVYSAAAWGLEPALIEAFADSIVEAHGRIAKPDDLALVLSAHSLPMRVLAMGDPYEKDFRAMAEAIIAELDRRELPRKQTRIAFQSQGMGGGDWLGPDLETTFSELREAGVDRLLMAPVGFLTEHVETAYDIDIEAKKLTEEMGFVQLERMEPMNTRERFIDALVAVTEPLLAQAAGH
ncbi:MAG: ferrochelatase, partial [Myxococcota bacterium]